MDKAKEAIEDILGDNSEIPIRFRNWYKVTTLTLTFLNGQHDLFPLVKKLQKC